MNDGRRSIDRPCWLAVKVRAWTTAVPTRTSTHGWTNSERLPPTTSRHCFHHLQIISGTMAKIYGCLRLRRRHATAAADDELCLRAKISRFFVGESSSWRVNVKRATDLRGEQSFRFLKSSSHFLVRLRYVIIAVRVIRSGAMVVEAPACRMKRYDYLSGWNEIWKIFTVDKMGWDNNNEKDWGDLKCM